MIAAVSLLLTLFALAPDARAQTQGPVTLTCTASNYPGLEMTRYPGSYVHQGDFATPNDPHQVFFGGINQLYVNGRYNTGVIVDLKFERVYIFMWVNGIWLWAVFAW